MRLSSTRTLNQLRPVLKESEASGPDPVYQVFSIEEGDGFDSQWANQTEIQPGLIGQEFTKTFGHYHPENSPDETYHLTSGSGVLLLQKKDLSEVLLIKVLPEEEVVITPEWGHALINSGQEKLVLRDDWRSGHTEADYAEMEKLHGMAYYLIEEAGETKAVANPHYQNLPPVQWLTAKEFSSRTLT